MIHDGDVDVSVLDPNFHHYDNRMMEVGNFNLIPAEEIPELQKRVVGGNALGRGLLNHLDSPCNK